MFADITKIEAPNESASGSQVEIKVYIKNISSVITGIMVGGALEYGASPWPSISFPNYQADFPAGQTYYFSGYFTMPSVKVKVHAYSYYYAIDEYGYGSWYLDDEMTKDISCSVVSWIKLATIGVAISPLTIKWIKLTTISVSITPLAIAAGWVKLVPTISIPITPLAIVTEWAKLGSLSVGIILKTVVLPPPPPPVPETCLVDSDCPEGYVCKDGKCVKEETNWLPIALIGGGAVALMTLTGKKPKEKSSSIPVRRPK